MSDILCKWLNEELRLSKAVDPQTLSKDFSSGYLIGEVLHKYQLQNDFSMFMKKDNSISRLNNFTRVEPTLQLLGISFDINTAQDLMQEKQGVAKRLLYQLYVSLEKKKKAEISGTMMEIMQPAANAGLHKKQHESYTARLHKVVKRDAELKLEKISQHYEEKCLQLNDRIVMTHPIHQKRQLQEVQDEKRMKNIEKPRVCDQSTTVQVPKPPPYTAQLNLKRRQQQQQRREQQVQAVQTEIAQFEMRKKKVTSGFASSSSDRPFLGDFLSGGSSQGCEIPGSGTKLTLQSNSKYIQDIRQRLEENAVALEQRERRRDRFLVEQLKAHEAQEEAQREEQLVKRLTRQTQQEQRLATQLLQIRGQKDVIRQNRLFREQQYQQRRERDFQEALEREAALAQRAKLDRAEEMTKELEFCKRNAAERALSKFKKHFNSCNETLEQIVDLATKVGEYRLITGNLIPEKMMREWKELLFSGLPLYEPIEGQQPGFEFSAPLDPVELKKQEILKNQDYDEYTSMGGEWAWPEEAGETKPPLTNNNILGHVVRRLTDITHQPIMEPPSPSFPHFTFKACVLGKFCAGKTTCLTKFAEAYGFYILSAETLIEEALNAYWNGEEVEDQQGEKHSDQLFTSSTSLKLDLDTQEENRDSNLRLSMRAMQGAAVEKELRKDNPILDELLVDIVVEAIRQMPAQSGWILDGFPVDITQAHMLEKALGGSVNEGNSAGSSRTNLAADPNPPGLPPPPLPVLDLALLLDISDECVIRRPSSQLDTCTSATTTSHSTEKNLYVAQIQHRITNFHDTWPKLEKWFGGEQNILVRVDADVDEEELNKRVESVLKQAMMQAMLRPQEDIIAGPATIASCQVLARRKVRYSSAKPRLVDQNRGLTNKTPTSPYLVDGHFRAASAASMTNEDSRGRPASPLPGSSSWVYVDESLPPEIPEYLLSHWNAVCDSYVNNIKTVMQQLRSQRTVINHHLFNIREEYKHYLGRPDLKQELVSHWQKDFNSIPDDMREDKDTKAELYLRLDELRERLWDISDKRKEEDEKEKAALMGDGWLEDHTAVLVNHHSVLMQVELDRFQDTLCILSVYYLSMNRLPELPSMLVCIPLLGTLENKDQDESTEPAGQGVSSHMDDADDKKKSKIRSDSKSKMQTEPVKTQPLPHEKLISDYEEALTAISKLSAEAHQGESKDQKEPTGSPNKKEKGKPRKQRGAPSPPAAPSPVPTDVENSAEARNQEVRNKIHKECAAAVDHEDNAAKVRIALVKGHGLVMVHSLQSRAEQTSGSMEKWLKDHYFAEMKSIEQLSELARYHIEAGAKLQNELVLECMDFYLNGDCLMVATPVPPPRPPPLEKPTRSTLTIIQLESFHQQICNVAPSGFMSSSEFSSLLSDMISVNMGRNTLPEPWINKNETQLMEIVSLLTDDYGLIDWRRFLLSAALPWPAPSLSQLLVVLQVFKAADTGHTGYINEEQYLQTELWFSNESVQPVPKDPLEPLPYDRLANLRKFFFQLFADHSFSPPQLDYVSMLLYFAADPNPAEGFVRALSVVLGQHLKHSLPAHLVKSMPSIDEATELSSSELVGDYKEEETPCASLGEQEVSIPALLAVICHKVKPLPPGCLSQEEHTKRLVQIFSELDYKPEDRVPFSILSQNLFIQGLMETSTHHQLVNIHNMLLAQHGEANTSTEGEANTLTVT